MIPLSIIASNARGEITDWMAEVLAADSTQVDALAWCERYARVAACKLLGASDSAGCHRWLCLAADAFVGWADARPPGARILASDAAPFFYACAGGHAAGAARIAALVSPDFVQGAEYEEDFAYARCLQLLLTETDPTAKVDELLAFWEGVSGGKEARFKLCQALLVGDAAEAAKTLGAVVRARPDHGAGRPDPEWTGTLGRLSLEGAALVWIAAQRGLTISVEHSRLPAGLLQAAAGKAPPANAWRLG